MRVRLASLVVAITALWWLGLRAPRERGGISCHGCELLETNLHRWSHYKQHRRH
jgi:hypothetical protein